MKEAKNFPVQAQSAEKIIDAMRQELLDDGFVETAPEIFTREPSTKPKGRKRRRRIRLQYGSRGYPL